jgi:calcium-dependent protein kinase
MEPSPGQNMTSNLKIIDFGNAERVKFKVNRTNSMGGTTMYMPPEAFSGWYSYAFDIWSCGVLLCILLIGHCPFKKNKK